MNKFLRSIAAAVLLGACISGAQAQRITYSETEREDSRRTNFEIIGKIEQNVLVFKNNRSENAISVYDNDMKLVSRVNQDYIPDRVINVDFVSYPGHAYMVYQYQRRNILYCMGVKIGSDGKKIGEPQELDTTQLGFASDNKIYTTLASEDKKRIMVMKINSKNNKQFVFTTVLLDENLKELKRDRIYMPMEYRNDFFTDFYLGNNGDMVFGKFTRTGGNDNISKVLIVTKSPATDSFATKELNLDGKYLDEIKIKIDNLNNQYLITAFYYKQRRGNIDGLYSAIFDRKSDSVVKSHFTEFADQLRIDARGESNTKMAFNDYFIKHMIPKVDGGFLIAAEAEYTSSRGNAFNRWDFLGYGSPWLSPSDYYYLQRYYGPYGWNSYRYNSSAGTRYHADNILVLSFDPNGQLEWSNVIPKVQYDDENDFLLSYGMMVTGGKIHFLFNEMERRNRIMNVHSISPDGQITRLPTLKNLDKGYEFMTKFAKQVGARQMIIPCFYRNYICFAKVDF
ncbi:MAG TPA: hypothetical protein VIK74_05970 [Parasegetibacter sp.]